MAACRGGGSPSLLLIAVGILLVNHAELQHLRAVQSVDLGRYAFGALLAVGAVLCWTWYPLRNADWLRAHPTQPPRVGDRAGRGDAAAGSGRACTCLGLVRTARRAVRCAARPRAAAVHRADAGARTARLLAGGLCWNEASQRLPTALAGQLIVFETLAALAYAFALRGAAPPPTTVAGIVLLVAGVYWALRIRPEPPPEASAGAPH